MKNIILTLLLLFTLPIHSNEVSPAVNIGVEEETQGCETIVKILTESYSSRDSKDPMKASYNNHGIGFKHDFNKYIEMFSLGKKWKNLEENVYKRSGNGNLIVTNNLDKDKIVAGLVLNSEVTKLNGISVLSLSDKDVDSIFRKNDFEIEIEFINPKTKNTKTISSIKKSYGYIAIDISLKEKIISDIDSKNSEHSANIDLQVEYALSATAFKPVGLIKEAIDKELEFNPLEKGRTGFACSLSPEAFKLLKLYDPQIKILNQIDTFAGLTQGTKFILSYSLWGNLNIQKQFFITNGTFKNNFKFQSFPFDAQKLSYDIILVNNGRANTNNSLFIPTNQAYKFLFGIKDVDLNEWKHSGADYKNDIMADGGYDNNSVTFYHNIERNFSYYLFKIILPIIIILFISLSVLWIHPREIEARLTVSIVCLLSLIAYTFIIDKDIPKLSYLTIMDYVVLVSYFFSVLPTIETIIVHNHINKTTNTKGLEYAMKIDKVAIKAIPASYFLILLWIFNSVISGNLYTIRSFTF